MADNTVEKVVPKTTLYCVAANSNQTQPVKVNAENQVFDNLPKGYELVLVKRGDSAANTVEETKQETASVEAQPQVCIDPNIFGNLTSGAGFDINNITAGLPIANLDYLKMMAPMPIQPGLQSNSGVASGNSVYDIAFQKAVEKLTKELNEGKIDEKEFVKRLNELKRELKESAAEEADEDQEIKTKHEDSKLTSSQRDSLNKFIGGTDNKTFTREDFQKDPKISGAQTATQNLDEVGTKRTVKVLADGTTVEITENASKEGAAGAVKGNRGGVGTAVVGAAEVIGGVAIGILTCWSGVGIAGGLAMAGDGVRRIYNSATEAQAYTAVITRPNGKKLTIKNNYREAFYNELYKELDVIKK